MPWNIGSKTFVRRVSLSPAFEGDNIWNQDQEAGIKVVDARHDAHDQDIAQGISRCLNIDGVNEMQAALNMNGFSITNLGVPALASSAARHGQIFDTMTFDDPSRTLELSAPDGNSLSVVIPGGDGGGGGEGTVTSITIGEGLDGASPITISGEIKLETIGVNQTFTGGIQSITLDKHGRVTQVTTGGVSGTNLSNSRDATTVTVISSTGNNTALPAATSTLAGVMAGSDKAKLDLYSKSGNNAVFVGDVTAFSDIALKSDLEPLYDALDAIMQIPAYLYRRRDLGSVEAGIIAQDVEEVLPSAVTEHEGLKAVSTRQLLALLIGAVQELAAKQK